MLFDPSYSHPVDAATDSNLKLEPVFFQPGSGWDSDINSDPDTPRPIPVVQLTTIQRGCLTFRNSLIHWGPSVLDNYIKFRVYFRCWRKGYTFLVSEDILKLLSPVGLQFTPQLL